MNMRRTRLSEIDKAWLSKKPAELRRYAAKMLPDHEHIDLFDWRYEPLYPVLETDRARAAAYLKSEHPMYLKYLERWSPQDDEQPFIALEFTRDGKVVDVALQDGNHRTAMAAILGIPSFRTIVGRQKASMPWE